MSKSKENKKNKLNEFETPKKWSLSKDFKNQNVSFETTFTRPNNKLQNKLNAVF